MVVALGNDRYRLLDTLRMYALELLTENEHQVAVAGHATHYVALAEAAELHVRGDDQLLWFDRLRADVANFRAAAEWSFSVGEDLSGARLAGALAWFWTLDGMLSEAIRYLERAVEAKGLPALVRAKALWGFGLLAASLGQLQRARDAGAESAALGREAGDDAATGCGLNAFAVAEWALGNHAAAAAAHDEAIQLFTRADDSWGLALCKVLRARTAIDLADHRGEVMAQDALVAAHKTQDRHLIGIALEQIARAQLADGNIDSAIDTATGALAAQESIGYTEGTIAALHLLGEARTLAGHLPAANDHHLRALSLADRIGHAAAVCEALEQLARVRACAGDDIEAIRLLTIAARDRDRLRLPARASEAATLQDLRKTLQDRVPGASAIIREAAGTETRSLVAELLT